MATKTPPKKWIRAASNFIALIPSRSICRMLAIFSGVELLLKLRIIFQARLSIMGAHNWYLRMRFWFVISQQYEDRGNGVFYLKECRQFVNWCWQVKNLPHPIFPYVLVISCILLTGTCKRNITCDCDKKTEEKERPERQAAIFAKEFQDKLYRTIFTKENDDKDPPTNKSIVVSTTPSTTNSPTNCSNDAQVRIETIVAFIWQWSTITLWGLLNNFRKGAEIICIYRPENSRFFSQNQFSVA